MHFNLSLGTREPWPTAARVGAAKDKRPASHDVNTPDDDIARLYRGPGATRISMEMLNPWHPVRLQVA